MQAIYYAHVMMAVPFDTLKLAKRLQAAGFTPDQAGEAAEALAEAVDDSDLATNTELALVRSDLSLLRRELKSDMELLRRDLTIRMGGMVLAGASIVLAGMGLML